MGTKLVYGAPEGCVSDSCPEPLLGILDVVPVIINVILVLSISVFFIILVVDGYNFITAGGDSDKIKDAQKSIIFSMLGFGLVFGAFLILQIVARVTGVNSGFSILPGSGNIAVSIQTTYTPTPVDSRLIHPFLTTTPPPFVDGDGTFLKTAHDIYRAVQPCGGVLIGFCIEETGERLLTTEYGGYSKEAVEVFKETSYNNFIGCGVQCLGFMAEVGFLMNGSYDTPDMPNDLSNNGNPMKLLAKHPGFLSVGKLTYDRLSDGANPEIGDIAVFYPDKSQGIGAFGHIALVDKIGSGNTFYSVESNWGNACKIVDDIYAHPVGNVVFYRLSFVP